MNLTAALSAQLLIARATAVAWQDARQRRSALARELGDYRSTADQQDLAAMLEQYPDGDTAPFRSILAQQSFIRGQKRVPALIGH